MGILGMEFDSIPKKLSGILLNCIVHRMECCLTVGSSVIIQVNYTTTQIVHCFHFTSVPDFSIGFCKYTEEHQSTEKCNRILFIKSTCTQSQNMIATAVRFLPKACLQLFC